MHISYPVRNSYTEEILHEFLNIYVPVRVAAKSADNIVYFFFNRIFEKIIKPFNEFQELHLPAYVQFDLYSGNSKGLISGFIGKRVGNGNVESTFFFSKNQKLELFCDAERNFGKKVRIRCKIAQVNKGVTTLFSKHPGKVGIGENTKAQEAAAESFTGGFLFLKRKDYLFFSNQAFFFE